MSTGAHLRTAPRTLRPLAALCAAMLPPEAGGPDPVVVADLVDRHLRHAPSATRLAVHAGAAALGAAARATTGRSLGQLAPGRRAQVLERVAGVNDDLRAAVDGLKSLIVLAHGADQAAPEMLAASRRTSPARPDPELDVTSSQWWPAVSSADAVVVGSGAGGAMTARSLARRGLDVVIVEEGRRWSVEEFRTGHPLARYAGLYRDGGTTIAFGRPPVVLPLGRGVGGTTLVNSGTCFRPPDRVQRHWRDSWGLSLADPDDLDRHLGDVERTLRVSPVPLDVMGGNGRMLLHASDQLGWGARPLDRNAEGCTGSCQCAIGCPNNAKLGVHLSVLPDACRHGARIVTDARVRRIVTAGGRARGVVARRADGSRFEIHAPVVVVACGATESPGLVRRSGLGSHPDVGRNLTVHPALGLAGRFAEPVVAWKGVLQSATVERFHEDEGIVIEATSTPPGMGSMILPGLGVPLLREIEHADHLATFGAMIADAPVGRVGSAGGHTVICYDLDRGDGTRLLGALRRMGQALFAAGAVELLTGIPGASPARSEGELDAQLARTDHRDLHLAAFHPAGTLRAGSDPQRCPVDEAGRLRGVEGVWVTDASVLPTCPEVNPQVSIMAVALAIAEGVAGT